MAHFEPQIKKKIWGGVHHPAQIPREWEGTPPRRLKPHAFGAWPLHKILSMPLGRARLVA